MWLLRFDEEEVAITLVADVGENPLIDAVGVGDDARSGGLPENFLQSDDSNGVGGAFASFKLAQTFTPPTDVYVQWADALVIRQGRDFVATCALYTTSGGFPTGTRVARGSTMTAVGSDPAWSTCTFLDGNGNPKPVSLVGGAQYALVISWSGGNGSNTLLWRTDSTDPTYAGGNALRSRSSGAWDRTTPLPTYDNMFRLR